MNKLENTNLPDWFNLNDYNICSSFGIFEWYLNMGIRLEISFLLNNRKLDLSYDCKLMGSREQKADKFKNYIIPHNFKFFLEMRKLLFTKKWLQSQKIMMKTNLKDESTKGIQNIQSIDAWFIYEELIKASPQGEAIMNSVLEKTHRRKKLTKKESDLINKKATAEFVKLNFDCSNEQLIDDFKKYITSVREMNLDDPRIIYRDSRYILFDHEITIPKSAAGKQNYLLDIKSKNFNKRDFHRWHSFQILAYLDLFLWSQCFNQKINDSDIAKALNITPGKFSKETKLLAHKMLSLEYRHALHAQAAEALFNEKTKTSTTI